MADVLCAQNTCDAVYDEVASLLEDYPDADEAANCGQLAASIERSLMRDPTAYSFDPQDPDYWTAVAQRLRLRAQG